MTPEQRFTLDSRVTGIKKWLSETAPYITTEQRHLDEGTQARAYWHYGYMVALRDVIALLTESETKS